VWRRAPGRESRQLHLFEWVVDRCDEAEVGGASPGGAAPDAVGFPSPRPSPLPLAEVEAPSVLGVKSRATQAPSAGQVFTPSARDEAAADLAIEGWEGSRQAHSPAERMRNRAEREPWYFCRAVHDSVM
jgi:hypothetical protein